MKSCIYTHVCLCCDYTTDYTHKWLFFDEIGIISAIFSTKFTLFRYSKGLKMIRGVFYVKLATDHGLSISTHVQTLWFYDFICGHFFEIILLIRLELSRGKYSRIGHSESIRLNRIKNHHLRRFDPSCGFIKEVRYKPKEFRNQKKNHK